MNTVFPLGFFQQQGQAILSGQGAEAGIVNIPLAPVADRRGKRV